MEILYGSLCGVRLPAVFFVCTRKALDSQVELCNDTQSVSGPFGSCLLASGLRDYRRIIYESLKRQHGNCSSKPGPTEVASRGVGYWGVCKGIVKFVDFVFLLCVELAALMLVITRIEDLCSKFRVKLQ